MVGYFACLTVLRLGVVEELNIYNNSYYKFKVVRDRSLHCVAVTLAVGPNHR